MGCPGPLAGDFLVRGIRTDFNVLGPRNLTVSPDVNCAKKRLVCQRRKNSPSHVTGKVDHPFHTVRVRHLYPEARKRLYVGGSDHEPIIARRSPDRKRRPMGTGRILTLPPSSSSAWDRNAVPHAGRQRLRQAHGCRPACGTAFQGQCQDAPKGTQPSIPCLFLQRAQRILWQGYYR
jgi:hypothetical protein